MKLRETTAEGKCAWCGGEDHHGVVCSLISSVGLYNEEDVRSVTLFRVVKQDNLTFTSA